MYICHWENYAVADLGLREGGKSPSDVKRIKLVPNEAVAHPAYGQDVFRMTRVFF